MLLQGYGAVVAGLSVDGIIVRDLQLPEQARHAYVLRPLPARARRLNTWLNLLRRQLMGISYISPAKLRWVWRGVTGDWNEEQVLQCCSAAGSRRTSFGRCNACRLLPKLDKFFPVLQAPE